jgi:CheY-like chemotaxis protein/HPt (histidine-containing phosphotransfer) domain-containing protein
MDGLTAAKIILDGGRQDTPPIILLSGHGRKADIEAAQHLGVKGLLVKPVKASSLVETILRVCGCDKANPGGSATPPCQPPDVLGGIDVLLVEDNPTNRQVAQELLLSAGIRVDTATNGCEAVAAVQGKPYDAVLMDIQMPEMDGLEATRIIREQLALTDLPIIAMTAHALSGDREKCLQAGMNGYVTKPISRQTLFAALQENVAARWRKPAPQVPRRADNSPHPSPTAIPGVDVAEGVTRIGGSWRTYREILENFCHAHRTVPSELRALIAAGEDVSARRRAHALKGAAGNVSAMDIVLAAEALEGATALSDGRHAEDLLRTLEDAFARLCGALFDSATRSGSSAAPVSTQAFKRPLDITRRLLERLDGALRDCDPIESERLLRDVKSGLSSNGLAAAVASLEELVSQYQFDGAREALRELSAELQRLSG